MTGDDAIAQDRRDLQRGLAVNAAGYALKAAHPVLTVFLVRAYGAEVFGLFLAAQSVLLLLSRVCILGLDKAMLWWVPQQDPGRRLLGARASATLVGASAVVVTVGCMLGAPWLALAVDAPQATGALRWMSVALVPMTLMELTLGAIMGTRRMGTNVMVRETLLPLALVGGGLILWPLGWGVDGLAVAMVLSYLLALGISVASARRVFTDDLDPASGVRLPTRLWSYSWPLWVAELANTSLLRLDTWAMAALTDLRTVGIYGVVLQFGNTIRAIRRSFDPIVLAITTRISVERDAHRLASGYSYATAMVIGTQLPLLGFFIVFAPDLLSLYGEEFVVGAPAVIMLSVFWVLNGAASLAGIVVNAYGYSRLSLVNMVGAAGLQLGLLWLLVPRWGLEGAALAVGLTYTLLSSAQVVQMRIITRGFHFRRDTLTTIGLGVGAGVALLLAWVVMPASHELWMRAVAYALCTGVYLVAFLPIARRGGAT